MEEKYGKLTLKEYQNTGKIFRKEQVSYDLLQLETNDDFNILA